ncbi:MAG: hypothetical protein Q6M54_11615 [Thermostichus sp. DRC_bins_24]
MLSFIFEECSPDKKFIEYLDYGHITLQGSFGSCSSKTGSRNLYLMMSITWLLDGIEKFITQKKKEHEYIGADSSFGFWMIRSANHISVTSRLGGRIHIEDLNDEELIQCTWQSLNQFLLLNEKRFDRSGEEGSYFSDFDMAYANFKNSFKL